jgi:transposase
MDTSRAGVLGSESIVRRDLVKTEGERRQRTIAEKRKIVEETLVPGTSVARVARAHEVNANQVFGWRRLYQRGRLGGEKAEATSLLPVRVADVVAPVRRRAMNLGRIEVESSKGVLRLEGTVDAATLRLVLERLLA